jgi:hypothetical protein
MIILEIEVEALTELAEAIEVIFLYLNFFNIR